MKKTAAELYRDIDFTHAKRRPVVPSEPGKTKISIRLDNRVLDHFRSIVEPPGAGNYQTLVKDALMAYIQQHSVLEAVRQAVRDEFHSIAKQARLTRSSPIGSVNTDRRHLGSPPKTPHFARGPRHFSWKATAPCKKPSIISSKTNPPKPGPDDEF
jgi:uncharacterized protein (DUF4415 family)